MKIIILILICFLGNQRPVITGCRQVTMHRSMGQLLTYWQRESERREQDNFNWWIKRYEKGWEAGNKPPWYLRERFEEYLKGK